MSFLEVRMVPITAPRETMIGDFLIPLSFLFLFPGASDSITQRICQSHMT